MRKLTLNKEIIANLSDEEASKIKGGTQGTRVSCKSVWGCGCPDTMPLQCVTCQKYSSNMPTQPQAVQCAACGI